MKEAKFLDALDLAPGATDAEGPMALPVCPYTYCSFNGHKHSPAVPLRSFLASRRRRIKTQQSMKLKGVSAFRKKSGEKSSGGGGAKIAPLIDEEAVGDFFVEVDAGRGHRREEGRGRRHLHRVGRGQRQEEGRGGGAATASAARPRTPAGGGEGADTARLLRPTAGSRWSGRVGEGRCRRQLQERDGVATGFCLRAVGDWSFCVCEANTVSNANSRMPVAFSFTLLESVLDHTR